MDDQEKSSDTAHNNTPNVKAGAQKSQGIDDVDSTNTMQEQQNDSDDSDYDLAFTCTLCQRSFTGYKPFRQHEKGAKHLKAVLRQKSEKKLTKKLENDLNEPSGKQESFLDQEPFAICKTCNKQFWGPDAFELHLESRGHLKKTATAKIMEQITDDGTINIDKLMALRKQERGCRNVMSETGAVASSPTDDDDGNVSDGRSSSDHHQFECAACEKVFSGIESWYQHLTSKTHEKKIHQKKMLGELTSGGSSQGSKETSSRYSDGIQLDGDVLVCKMCHMSFSGAENAAAHLKSRGHKKKLEHIAWKKSLSDVQKHNELSKSDTQPLIAGTVSQSLEPTSKSGGKQQVQEIKSENGGPSGSSEASTSISVEQSNNASSASAHFNVVPSAPPSEMTSASSKENAAAETLLCYKTYKEYKQIMNSIQSEKE